MAQRSFDILILGGGQAARRAAEGARAAANDASIAIVGEEAHPPYDRPPLSKAALTGKSGTASCDVRAIDSYATDRITLLLGQRAARIDVGRKAVVTADSDTVHYQRLIIATGSRPRQLPMPAGVAERVITLRTKEDAQRLSAQLEPGAKIVIVGAGFIGLEVAAAAHGRGASVTVIEARDEVLARALPAPAARRIAALHTAAGIDLRLGVELYRIERSEGGRLRVETSAGEIPADFVVVGIGVAPNSEIATEAGIETADGICVAATGQTSDPDVVAAGEVTRHPVSGSEAPLRLESWQVAQLQAEAAGRTAAGQPAAHMVAPWFWTDQLGVNVQILGLVPADRPLITREYPSGAAVMFAVNEAGALRGLIAFNSGADVSVGRRLLGQIVDAPQLADPSVALRQVLRSGGNGRI